MIDLLAVGECLVDRIVDPSTGHVDTVAGGAPANVAINVARLGGNAAVRCAVGDDAEGELVCRTLIGSGVVTDLVERDPRRPTGWVEILRSTDTPRFTVHRGADAHLAPLDALPEGVRWVHTSAFALSRTPTRDAVLALLRQAHDAGVPVSVDPNYHAAVWGGEPLDALWEAVGLAGVVKPSRDDLVRIFGDGDVHEGARRFHDRGATVVIVTDGGGPVRVFVAGEEVARVPVPPTEVVDVTGAGDAFWAGFILARDDGLDLDTAVRAAVRLAALKVTRVGHLPTGLDRRAFYDRLAG